MKTNCGSEQFSDLANVTSELRVVTGPDLLITDQGHTHMIIAHQTDRHCFLDADVVLLRSS
jgi:hypothetical protein